MLHLKYQRHIFAEHGGNGGRDKCHGTDGADIYIDVPCGTVVYNAENGKYVCDVTEDGQCVMLLKGGRGGLGNYQFRTATNQAPRYAQPGEPMQEMTIILELKLLADVGLVGFPNAGKSTLLSTLSSAKPKIANYPFTTLNPQLGVMYAHNREFVMVDLPGLIEGAHMGVGLGDRFLGHAERTKLILHVIDGSESDWANRYKTIRHEMDSYGGGLLNKPEIVIINKIDALDDDELKNRLSEFKKSFGRKKKPTILTISAAGHIGIEEMISAIEKQMLGLE